MPSLLSTPARQSTAVLLLGIVAVAVIYLAADRVDEQAFGDVYQDESASGVRAALGRPDYELLRRPDTPVWVWVDDLSHTAYYVYFYPNAQHVAKAVERTATYRCSSPPLLPHRELC
jgi:hypothetical protein